MNKNIIYVIVLLTSLSALIATLFSCIFGIIVLVDIHKHSDFHTQFDWNQSFTANTTVSLRRFHQNGPKYWNNYSTPFDFGTDSTTFVFNRSDGYNNYKLYTRIRKLASALASGRRTVKALIGGGTPYACDRHWNQRAAAIWGYLFIELIQTKNPPNIITTSPIDSTNPCLNVSLSRLFAFTYTDHLIGSLAPYTVQKWYGDSIMPLTHIAAVAVTGQHATYFVIASLDENTHRIRCQKCTTHYAVDERGQQIVNLTQLNYTTIMPQSYNIIALRT